MRGMNSGINIKRPDGDRCLPRGARPPGAYRAGDLRLDRPAVDGEQKGAGPRARRRRTDGRGPGLAWSAEPAGRRLLRIGFGLLWVFDGILQAQPAIAAGWASQVIL